MPMQPRAFSPTRFEAAALLVVAACHESSSTPPSTEPPAPATLVVGAALERRVSFASVLANPAAFDGQQVVLSGVLSGVLSVGLEDNALYASFDAFRYGIDLDSLWLVLRRSEAASQPGNQGRFVEVRGTFRAPDLRFQWPRGGTLDAARIVGTLPVIERPGPPPVEP